MINRRRFMTTAGVAASGALIAPRWATSLTSSQPYQATTSSGKLYGLLDCADADVLAAFRRSRAGILKCTVNDKTHCPDAGQQWGVVSVLNDLYFGLCGGLYIADASQHEVFKKELHKIGQYAQDGPGRPVLPWETSLDGEKRTFNADPGMDLDRCAQFVLMVWRLYEMTGDRQIASDLYPQCAMVVEFLRKRDADGDLLPEGSPERWYDSSGQVMCAASSVSYIGDTVVNTWKDFGATIFYWESLRSLAQIERVLGKNTDAEVHLERASRVKAAILKTFWNDPSEGFLAWIEKNGTAHDDWITGNNLHAVACGIADLDQSAKILACLERHRAELEEVVPCRVRIGTFAPGLCSNRPDDYWNGGIWTLVAAPDMRARALRGDLSGALRVARLLATKPEVTEFGFYEAYDGKTGKPNQCRGLLMNNGGFLWGIAEAVLGIEPAADEILFRPVVPREILPARYLLRYRGADVEISWAAHKHRSAKLNGASLPRDARGFFRLNLARPSRAVYGLEIRVSA